MNILVLSGKKIDLDLAALSSGGHVFSEVRQAMVSRGVRHLEKEGAECVLLAPDAGDTTWPRAIARIRNEYGLRVILISGEGMVDDKAVSLGAYDCFPLDEKVGPNLARSLAHLKEALRLKRRLDRGREMLDWMERTDKFGSWAMDREGRFHWSAGFRRVFAEDGEFGAKDFKGLRKYVHPEDLEIFDKANEATFEQGWPLDFEYRVASPGGKVRHLHVNRAVEPDPGGGVARAWGMARDVSLNKEFEELLFRRDSILQVLTVFASRFLHDTNWEEGFGKAVGELGTATDATRVYFFKRTDGGEDGERLSMQHEWAAEGIPLVREKEIVLSPEHPGFQAWRAALLRRKVISGHVRDFRKEERQLLGAAGARSVMIVPIFAGAVWWGFLGLSEHRRERDWLPVEMESLMLAANIFGSAIHHTTLAAKLRDANRTAEEASSAAREASMAKSMFLANMSHEIRTPIGGIIGMAEMLITTGLNPVQREHADMIRDASNALLTIVNDVLDISKIEAGKMELHPEDFDFRKELTTCVRSFGPQASANGIVFSYTVDEEVPKWVRGDSARLGQVLRNLIGNAIKFTAEGQIELTVNVSRRDEARLCLLFQVRDTGEGIAREKLDDIFSVFIQADSSLRKKHQGTGLGLAISRELVNMMGGEIGVESEVGKGSTFHFTAWFDPSETLAGEDEETIDPLPAPQHLNILLAEDNPMNRKFLTHFLTMFGHSVSTAENGRKALDVLEKQGKEFDLVLMDIQMPEMSGIEATRAIRESDGKRYDSTIPVIALTAYAMRGDRERMIGAGMDDYVSKPVDMQELSATIIRCMGGRRGSEPAMKPSPRAEERPVTIELDMDSLTERFQGNTELLRDILDLFLLEAEEKMAMLDKGVEALDAKEMGAALHAITNIASHVLAMDVVNRSRAMEKRCYLGELDVVIKEVGELKPRFAALVRAVESVLAEL